AVEQRNATPREQQIVGALAGQDRFREEQVGGALLVGDLEIAVEILQAQRAREAAPLIEHFGGGDPCHPRAAGVGLLVAIADREIERSIAPAGTRYAIESAVFLESLRVFDLAACLVPAVVQPTPLHAHSHAGTSVGAHIGARRIDRALGGNQRDLDRYTALRLGL